MEEKLCNTIQEFEDIFGNVPFKDLDKIKKHIKNNFISISLIEKKIEILEKLQKEFKDNEEIRIKIIAYKELLDERSRDGLYFKI